MIISTKKITFAVITNSLKNYIMKKLLLIAVVVTAGLSSCKKDRDCVCTGNDLLQDITYTYEATKSDAEETCDAQSTAYGLIGGGSCSLD